MAEAVEKLVRLALICRSTGAAPSATVMMVPVASLLPWRRRMVPPMLDRVGLARLLMAVFTPASTRKSMGPVLVDWSVPPVRFTVVAARVRLLVELWVKVPPLMLRVVTRAPVFQPRASCAVVSTVPPVFTVTVPRTMPVPPPPLALSWRVPALMVAPPENVLNPVSCRVPVPVFTKAPEPEMTPA